VKASQLLQARILKNWEQTVSAQKLGVSQSYLSLLETGKRPVSKKLAERMVKVFKLPPTNLPLKTNLVNLCTVRDKTIAKDLGTLGYPKFAYLSTHRKKNPVTVLFSALKSDDLESRIVESLPWIVLTFPELNWKELINLCKLNDLQNRLGFITSLALKLAAKYRDQEKIDILSQRESELSRSRLLREDTLCQNSISETEKKWLKVHRSREARFWRILSDIKPKHLDYGKS